MKTYNQFILSTNETYQIFESIQIDDRNYFLDIFNSIYEHHLTDFEKSLIDSYNFRLNETWFSDLKDKAEKNVLKIKSKAGELLTSIAQKAKDILDFVKQLATQIKDAVTNMFNDSLQTLKSKIIPKPEFLQLIATYMDKRNDKNLKKYLSSCSDLIKFIFKELPVKLFNKLVNFFNGVFNKGTNEGFSYFCNEFLNEADDAEAEKKSFLQKLGEKIASFPPFSWIPKIEEIIKKGLAVIRNFIEKFFMWLDKEEQVTEAIDLTRRAGDAKLSRFSRSLIFLFDILEIYVIYKYNENGGDKLNKFMNALKNGDITAYQNNIKNISLGEIYKQIGVSPQDIINSIKSIAEKIPYVSDILAILKNLALCVGIYQVIQPSLAKFNSGEKTTGTAPQGTTTQPTTTQPTTTQPAQGIPAPAPTTPK